MKEKEFVGEGVFLASGHSLLSTPTLHIISLETPAVTAGHHPDCPNSEPFNMKLVEASLKVL